MIQQPTANLSNSDKKGFSGSISYQVTMFSPQSHLFEVTLRVDGWRSPTLDLIMPVWTPGSYLIREYARHLQDFSAKGEGTQPLLWQKMTKNHWQVGTEDIHSIIVQYRIFANELTVRTNHLDNTHGYFNGAAMFFFVPGYEYYPMELTIVPPYSHWSITTALSSLHSAEPGQPQTFLVPDFNTLVDSPVEVGEHHCFSFYAIGKPHQLVVWGKGNLNADHLIEDMQKIIRVESDLFGGLPYDHYLFFLHLTSRGYGGLEHKDCCSLIYQRFGFRDRHKYHRFIQLVAHEFFHLWNVKRIRPQFTTREIPPNPLDFSYSEENYTPCLWFSEGTTSYYDGLIPLRAGIYDAKTYLTYLSQEITHYLTKPGRLVQPLTESSFDAWIKLYRPDANSANSQISYYLKGEMVSLVLDLFIRSRHQNRHSMDDVLRQMWCQYGVTQTPFTHAQLLSVIEVVAGTDLSDFFHRYLFTTEELPLSTYLNLFGLNLQSNGDDAHRPPYLGVNFEMDGGKEVVKSVDYGSPAWVAGIDSEDEIVAVDGLRITARQFANRLLDYKPGDVVTLSLFHQDSLCTLRVTLAEHQPNSYHLVPVTDPSEGQVDLCQQWLGESLWS
ncbi:MAG: M61 family metallopeptidase [Synechococcales bacterium]|nr:M61 family metallopeptidase [Synechococcales bacterium]